MWFSFDDKEGNLIICGNDRFFITSTPAGRKFVVSARCSHRGGPLNLGDKKSASGCIRCPWHNLNTPLQSLEKRSIPAIRNGSNWHVKLPSSLCGSHVVVMPNPGDTKQQPMSQ